MLDVQLEGARAGTGPDIRDEERVANEAAGEFCVPQDSMERFIARKAPFSQSEIFSGSHALYRFILDLWQANTAQTFSL